MSLVTAIIAVVHMLSFMLNYERVQSGSGGLQQSAQRSLKHTRQVLSIACCQVRCMRCSSIQLRYVDHHSTPDC